MGVHMVPVQGHPDSLLWLCIHLHDTGPTFHVGTSHTGVTSPL